MVGSTEAVTEVEPTEVVMAWVREVAKTILTVVVAVVEVVLEEEAKAKAWPQLAAPASSTVSARHAASGVGSTIELHKRRAALDRVPRANNPTCFEENLCC